MNPKQDKGYWRRWAAVVRAHGLNKLPKADQDAERHAITLDDTKGRTSEHKKVTHNKEITKLFRVLEFKANPNCLNAAYPVANPEIEEEADEQRRCVFAISEKGLTDKEIQEIAAPFCRRHHVSTWKLLPSAVMKEMVVWKQFQPSAIAERRRLISTPLAQAVRPLDDEPFVYNLKPSKFSRPPVTNQTTKQEQHHDSHH